MATIDDVDNARAAAALAFASYRAAFEECSRLGIPGLGARRDNAIGERVRTAVVQLCADYSAELAHDVREMRRRIRDAKTASEATP